MNCRNAENLIMNYIDNTLSPNDAEKLNEHLKHCEDCKESFAVYEMMVDNLESNELISAPADFEEKLMLRINEITPVYFTHEKVSLDTLNSILWGTFTILFGTGIMLNMYSEPLMAYISQNKYIADFYATVTPIGNLIAESINEAFIYIQNITVSMSGVITYSKFVCGILVVVLCFIQVWIKRSKVDA